MKSLDDPAFLLHHWSEEFCSIVMVVGLCLMTQRSRVRFQSLPILFFVKVGHAQSVSVQKERLDGDKITLCYCGIKKLFAKNEEPNFLSG